MEQSQTKIRRNSRRPTARPWRVVMPATKHAKSPFCVRKSRAHLVHRFSVLIRTLRGRNEKPNNNSMKLHLPSKQIVTPPGSRNTSGLVRANRELSRRGFLGAGMTLAAAGVLAAKASDSSPSDPGPGNQGLDAQNPDSMWPPTTDSKSLVPTFKYPFSLANKRVYEGGWSREVTVRELPVSKSMAGVNMRLTAGGVRELHWHTASEWAIMLYGTARITAIDADGKSFVADVKENDLWYFPSGIPHSIQGLNPDGCEFMLVFDDGEFSESETVLLSDAMAHLAPEVLAKNFTVGEKAFANVPKQELFIFQTDVPGGLADDQKSAAGALGKSPKDFAFRT